MAMPDLSPPSKNTSFFLWGLLILLGLIPFLWPGDTLWVNDESLIILKSFSILQGTIATSGLKGTLGILYGPMPIWIYSLGLLLTKNLIYLTMIRSFLFMSGIVISLFWLSRLSKLEPIWGAIALLSPYLWLYSRPLWDNTFLIPFSALALCAYVSFSIRPTIAKLSVTLFCLTAMFLTHLMSAAFILPIAIHFICFHRDWIKTNRKIFVLQIILALLLCLPYLIQSIKTILIAVPPVMQVAHKGVIAADHGIHFSLQGFVFPFFGGRFFSAWGLDYFFGQNWMENGTSPWISLLKIAVKISYLGILLVWIGLGIAIKNIWKWRSEVKPRRENGQLHLDLITVGVFIVMILMNGILKTFGHPHYYNATWICYFYFVWRALSLPVKNGEIFFSIIKIIYIFSLAFILATLILNIHQQGGNRDIHYGATLKNQIEVAQKLNEYDSRSSIEFKVKNYIYFPHALTALRKIYQPKSSPDAPVCALSVDYLHPEKNDGWITVRVKEGGTITHCNK